MPPRLPPVLTELDLPDAELQAAALDGQLYAVGGCWRSIAEIDDPVGRATAIAHALGGRVIAAEATAAWVWGARGAAPLPHRGLVTARTRLKHVAPGVTVRQVVIDDDEVQMLGGATVTTPVRTLVDLARLGEWRPRDQAAARDLVVLHHIDIDDAVRLMDRREKVSHRLRALSRLSSVVPSLAPPSPSSASEPSSGVSRH